MNADNKYILGSEWIYYKLYTGPKLADKILTIYLLPIIERLYDEQLISLIFYVRYNDPDYHIRLRFKTNNYFNVINYITPVLKHLLNILDVSKVVVDTYVQERDRYLACNIEVIESIFSIDSFACIQILNRLQIAGVSNSYLRWLLAIKLIDDIMYGLKYNTEKKYFMLSRFATTFREEHNYIGHSYTKQINDKYRKYYKPIEDIEKELLCNNVQIDDILKRRKADLAELLPSLKIDKNNEERIVGGLIHMLMNKWFRTQNRLYEMLIYSFMEKLYKKQYYCSNKGILKRLNTKY